MVKFFKKYHKWIGIIITLFILLFAFSGIVLNHRSFFSSIDVNRSVLPDEYEYNNWNNAAVKGTVKLSSDSILIYGNIGIWLTDSLFSEFTSFNAGFPKGIDNKKICKIFLKESGELFAGTFFGLYQYSFKDNKWFLINLPLHKNRITDIEEKGDTLLVLSRSYLLKSADYINFSKQMLPKPKGYDNKIGLFKTLWVIHSGEIYGNIGKLFVDLVGVIFIFLSITGLILFFNPKVIKRKNTKQKDVTTLGKTRRWNLKWHNKIGWTTIVFLIITTITGMFLRPPLLIAIANAKVEKIPHTILDSPNPWFDKLRRIIYDNNNDRYIVATLDGIYYSDDNFATSMNKYSSQPPVSVMGVNVFNFVNDSTLLVGSFEGLFLWNTVTDEVFDYIDKKPYIKPKIQGPPIGNYIVTGFSNDLNGQDVFFDYGRGALAINYNESFVKMPDLIASQPMSLWNFALEVHTARIYQAIIGGFYILIIPLSGIFILFLLVSGFVVWYKKHRT